MADAGQLLSELTRLQSEIRALEVEQASIANTEDLSAVYHRGAANLAVGAEVPTYRPTSASSVPAGTTLVVGDSGNFNEVPWGSVPGRSDAVSFVAVPCANQADCLDENFCYSWYECDPCEWCEGTTCVPRDKNRPCQASWECPCPNGDFPFECSEQRCRQTCRENADCEPEEVCGLLDGYCGPGCESDADCIPGSPTAVGDARTGTLCLDHVCTYPCEPPVFCTDDAGCPEDQYCAPREMRAQGDPAAGAAYACESGCRGDSSCDQAAGETCVDRQCVKVCQSDSDCSADEVCNSRRCARVGLLCLGDSDCPEGEFCNGDGRCQAGCRSSADCSAELGETCNDGNCEILCSDSSGCPEGEVCLKGTCAYASIGGGEPIDDRFGCDCGEACTQAGQCLPAVCLVDDDCEDCSYCDGGFCVPGCDADNPCDAGRCCGPDQKCHLICASDADCPSPEMCMEGGCCGIACEPIIPCITSADCGDGSYCGSEGICESGCGVDSDCEPGQACLANNCETPCTTNGDCGPGRGCVGGACRTVPTVCQNDTGCPEGQVCLSGECSFGCRSDSQCDPFEACIENQCVSPCASDQECIANGLGTTCQGGVCKTISGAVEGDGGRTGCECWERCNELGQCKPIPCTTQAECAVDDACGSCLTTGFCGYCVTDSDCPSGMLCEDGTCQFQCIPEVPCDSGEACASGFYCNGEICVEGCGSDAECPGQVCRSGSCETPCSSDAGCAPSEQCLSGTCRFVGDRCANDFDCTSGQFCNQGVCETDNRCFTAADCDTGETCGPSGFCLAEQTSAPEPEAPNPSRIGCQSCAEFCGPDYLCHPAKCNSASDCDCGFCNASGECQEECFVDTDCPNGSYCVGGECIECKTSPDCWARYGQLDMVCREGVCETPCGVALSTGDCFQGLAFGDTCENCPTRCPLGSTCRKTDKICGVSEFYDEGLGRKVTRPVYCQVCAKACSSSTECGEGNVCFGGLCEAGDGRCESAADCVEAGLADGLSYVCVRNQCVERGEICFTGSDCDEGQVCDGGECRVGECGDEDPCQGGKTCVENRCVWTCDVPPITCSDLQACPPGMTCSSGVCIRPGFVGVGQVLCPFGETCVGGACLTLTPGSAQECSGSFGCQAGQECFQGRCRAIEASAPSSPSTTPADAAAREQDPCEKKGLCCGKDGFCAPCNCDEDHPCEDGFCCDGASGQCVQRSKHPATKFGAPRGCSYGPVYCEVLLPGGSAVNPSTDFEDPSYPGCEVTQDAQGERKVVCWSGKPLGPEQIKTRLAQACATPNQIPEPVVGEMECYNDRDCGDCMRCYSYWVTNDAARGAASTIVDQNGQVVQLDRALSSKCVARANPEQNCQCEEDSDCGPCETCSYDENRGTGFCVAQCEDLCPCGGELSDGGTCPNCEDVYGPCAKEVKTNVAPERVDPETGGLLPAKNACGCAVNLENNCCEAYRTLESLRDGKLDSGCIEKIQVTASGRTSWQQAGKCLDFEKGICAECVRDDQCQGVQTCKNGICVGQCGGQNTDPPQGVDCSCCSEAGQCRGLNESWMESDQVGKGPWTVTAATSDPEAPFQTFTVTEPSYATAKQIAQSYPNVERIVSMEPGGFDGRCRPCTCTDTGIDCEVYEDCGNSCYRWVQNGADEAYARDAERIRLTGQIQDAQRGIPDLKERADFLEGQVMEEQAQVDYWQGQVNLGFPGAAAQLAAAQQRLATAEALALNASQSLANVETIVASLMEQLALLSRAPAGWTQERVCDCCVDGLCRDEDECTYGTCYTCIEEYSGAFSAALYGKVLENETCVTDGAAGRQYYRAEVGQCVKYPCTSPPDIEDRYGKIRNERYYEYCTGSIILCFQNFDADEWKQGWKFYWNLANSGTFIGGIQMSFPPAETLYSECLYPNPNAFVGGNTLPTFVDAVATHPCCNKSDLIYECDPKRPGCQIRLETLYEAGDPTFLIRRIKKEVDALKAYKQQLQGIKAYLQGIKTGNEQRVADLQDQLADTLLLLSQAQALQTEAEAQLAADEAALTAGLAVQDTLQQELDDAITARNQIADTIGGLVEERTAIEADLATFSADRAIYVSNRNSASQAYQQQVLALSDLRDLLAQRRAFLATLDPQSLAYFNLQQEIAALEAQEQDLLDQIQDLADAVNNWSGQVTAIDASIRDARDQLKVIEDSIAENEPFLQAAAFSVGVKKGQFDGQVAYCASISSSILAQRATIQEAANGIEGLNEKITETLPTQIKDAREIIANATASIAEIDKEIQRVTTEIGKKEAEVARLSALTPPTGFVGPVPRPTKALTSEEFAEFQSTVVGGVPSPKSDNYFDP